MVSKHHLRVRTVLEMKLSWQDWMADSASEQRCGNQRDSLTEQKIFRRKKLDGILFVYEPESEHEPEPEPEPESVELFSTTKYVPIRKHLKCSNALLVNLDNVFLINATLEIRLTSDNTPFCVKELRGKRANEGRSKDDIEDQSPFGYWRLLILEGNVSIHRISCRLREGIVDRDDAGGTDSRERTSAPMERYRFSAGAKALTKRIIRLRLRRGADCQDAPGRTNTGGYIAATCPDADASVCQPTADGGVTSTQCDANWSDSRATPAPPPPPPSTTSNWQEWRRRLDQ
ncbi:hypothetical protein V1478_016237 [Vespula squamosa]|uniref:Uncharacterized protein n=1 Tax=Vespula squamosa TaxID=30214 RepID=A0ABD2A1M9_VESSQ